MRLQVCLIIKNKKWGTKVEGIEVFNPDILKIWIKRD